MQLFIDNIVHYPAHRFIKQQHNNKVGRAVDKVKRNACYPPVEHHCRTADEQIRDGTQCTEKQTECTRNNAVQQNAVFFAHQPGDKCQQWPGVEIHNPPDAKAVDAAFDKGKGRHNQQHFSAKNKGEQHNKEGCYLYVWQPLHNKFAGFYYCNRHPHIGNIAGGKLFSFCQN